MLTQCISMPSDEIGDNQEDQENARAKLGALLPLSWLEGLVGFPDRGVQRLREGSHES